MASDLPPSAPLVLPGLTALREAAARRRAGAFCPGLDFVMGIPCRPITPATYSMLHAAGSRFIHGGTPMEGCIRNYLWFHSPLFVATDRPFAALRRWLALAPFRRQLLGPAWARPFLRLISSHRSHRYSVALALAGTDIAAHIEEAFADAPPASGRPGKPIATLEAQLVDIFAREYRWLPERTRHTPLRQLFQYLRCIQAAQGADLPDAAETALLIAHLKARNQALGHT